MNIFSVAEEDGSEAGCRVRTKLGCTCFAAGDFSSFPRTRVLGVAPSPVSLLRRYCWFLIISSVKGQQQRRLVVVGGLVLCGPSLCGLSWVKLDDALTIAPGTCKRRTGVQTHEYGGMGRKENLV